MKLTKTQLKQIIREELVKEASGGSEEDQEAVDLVYGVVQAWDAAHRKLRNFPESQKLFEDYLKSNLELYLQRWEEDRADL